MKQHNLCARVERALCIGSGSCVAIAPDAFELDEEGKASVRDVAAVDEETLREAAEMCPTMAIILEDQDGNRIYP